MTYQPDGQRSAAQQALHTVAENGPDQEALHTLAESRVLLPDPEPAEEPVGSAQALSLPVVEQGDGTRLVPVFTSPDRLEQVFPEVEHYNAVALGDLARGWPSDGPVLVVDVGTPEEMALTAQGVRDLLATA
ncbi:SseB family protein [Streptomyces sp. B8F3]|uniref:SseB family protein n=1 Tax=unclassified Streptomyces TaxID=2593676 RepID=UPI00325C717E